MLIAITGNNFAIKWGKSTDWWIVVDVNGAEHFTLHFEDFESALEQATKYAKALHLSQRF